LGRGTSAQVLASIADGGFNSLREDVFWGAIESEPGVLRFPPKYDELRATLRGAAQRGHSPIVILGLGNRHYGGGLPTTDSQIAGYARYAQFVATQLRADVRQFEVWNEWNSGFGSKPRVKRGDAAAYARLLASASAAVRRGNPDAQVIGGVTSGVDFPWFRALIAAGGLAHLDAVSVHSYTLFRQHPNPEGAIASLDSLRKLLKEAAPERDIPVYVTEIGWPTNRGKHGVSERGAAMYLTRFVLLARTRPWIGGVWWYDLIDDGDSDTSAEHRFGLMRRNLQPKPSYGAAKNVATLIESEKPLRAFRLSNGGYLVTGSDSHGPWAVGWAMRPAFLAWSGGSTREAAAPAAYASIAAQLPADGYPLIFRGDGDRWRPDSRWLEDRGSPPGVPQNFRVTSREPP